MELKELYYSERPWSIIKDFFLTFDKTRSTKTCKLIKPLCVHYKSLLEDEDVLPDTQFPFVYFYTMMNYRKNFNYTIFPSIN